MSEMSRLCPSQGKVSLPAVRYNRFAGLQKDPLANSGRWRSETVCLSCRAQQAQPLPQAVQLPGQWLLRTVSPEFMRFRQDTKCDQQTWQEFPFCTLASLWLWTGSVLCADLNTPALLRRRRTRALIARGCMPCSRQACSDLATILIGKD